MSQPTLYLMLGYPGAGKTTTAEAMAELTGAVHLASDRIRLQKFPQPQFTPEEHQQLYAAIDKQTEDLLRSGKSVIYDANLNRYIHRQEKYDICQRTGARAILLWVRADQSLAKQRATQEADSDPRRPYGNLDVPTFDRLVNEIEPPLPSEPVIEIDGTKVTLEYVAERLRSYHDQTSS